jgi:hypothetical protein
VSWHNYLTENRTRFRTEIATWLERNRGYKFGAALDLVNANYPLIAEWLGEGRSAEWAGTELLRLEAKRVAGES